MLQIPKAAQDRLSKLDTIYCKFLLPYATLSGDERKRLLQKIDSMRQTEDDVECIVKGNSIALNTFYRIARNTLAVWFPNGGSSSADTHAVDPKEVETDILHTNSEITHELIIIPGGRNLLEAGNGKELARMCLFRQY